MRGGAATASLSLCGCAADSADVVALGLFVLAGLFVALLFAVPAALRILDRHNHHQAMYHRRPWSAEAAERRKEGRERRRKDA